MVAGPSLPHDVYIRLNQQLEWANADRSLEGLKSAYYTSQRYEKERSIPALPFMPISFSLMLMCSGSENVSMNEMKGLRFRLRILPFSLWWYQRLEFWVCVGDTCGMHL